MRFLGALDSADPGQDGRRLVYRGCSVGALWSDEGKVADRGVHQYMRDLFSRYVVTTMFGCDVSSERGKEVLRTGALVSASFMC